MAATKKSSKAKPAKTPRSASKKTPAVPKPNPKSDVTSANAAALTATGTLSKRLVIKPGNSVLLMRAPEGFEALLEPLPEKVQIKKQARSTYDIVVAFHENLADVNAHAAKALSAVKAGGVVWLAYPKKTGAIKTDITRDKGWDSVYATGWRPVAQVSLDDTWSALRWRPASEVGS